MTAPEHGVDEERDERREPDGVYVLGQADQSYRAHVRAKYLLTGQV